jgi:hypothetical protein
MNLSLATKRRQLLDTGALLDVTRHARDHQIILPCAISVAAWAACGGRTIDFATNRGDALVTRILAASRAEAQHASPRRLAAAALGFALENAGNGHIIELELLVGPDDNGDPVATVDIAAY